MRTLGILVAFVLVAGGGLAAAWVGVNYWAPGTVGTPAHAGAITNGQPETCTNVNINVHAQGQEARTANFNAGDYVRATFEADGGFGRVDILMRLLDPQGTQLLVSPRAGNYDFTFPVKLRGAYEFVFDNRYSLYTSKNVALYYCVDRAGTRP
jgi:hypothetical protein